MMFFTSSVCHRGIHTSACRLRIFRSLSDTIGQTPVIAVPGVLSESARNRGVELYVKCEFFNPTGSVKDRLALALITDAEERSVLKPGMTVVEATSGNTGIALAALCAQRGYPFIAVMSDKFSVERRKIMRALGAKVVLVYGESGGYGAVEKALELSDAHGWVHLWQMHNQANARYHAITTGVEIVDDFLGRRLDFFVAGFSTGGTFAGISRALRRARSDTRMVLVEAAAAPMVLSGVPQERHATGWPTGAHPVHTHHRQHISPNFVPLVVEEVKNEGLISQVMLVSEEEALEARRRLLSFEGLGVGISGGTNVAAAIKTAEDAPDKSVVLTVVPDSADRYLSTFIMEDIEESMSEEEEAISLSTPSYQYSGTRRETKEMMAMTT